MASLNRVFLIGNLTRDPEVRYTPSGTAVSDLRMAVSRRFRTGGGEDREETCYVNVTVWARQAETCGQYLSKGSPLLVEGRLKYDEWEKEGQKNSRLSVVGERVQFLGAPRSGAGFRDRREDGPEREPPRGDRAAGGSDVPDEAPGEAEADLPSLDASGDDDNLPF